MANASKIQQSAVLAYRFENDAPRVLMITSRGRGRWVLPKGCIETGQTAIQAAQCEAFEEAGIKGHIADTKIGSYSYCKIDEPSGNKYKVRVYPMTVSDIADDWPEKNQRDRIWMDFPRAASSVEEPELRIILKEFGEMLTTLTAKSA